MKVIFFGTSQFAVKALERLMDSSHDVLAVVTQPDRPKGRALKLMPTPLKEAAIKHGIADIYQPEILDNDFCNTLKHYDADLFVVISYGHILKQCILNVPKYYSINIHASLLPKYRGASPINQSIIDGQTLTGVTAIKMNEKMDQGDILGKIETKIGLHEDALSLAERLADIGANLLIETMDAIEKNNVIPKPQDQSEATYVKKMKKEDGLIDWKKDAVSINNLIRGVVPWPGAYTSFSNKILKIWKTEFI
ncbi:MAG: methionyl-tRNA formyltransferase, partial [Candidatus Omnitrophica bacterium]|nr:methionyl-tRNA formyltransferase [Candidatus Omnitrophota bacterium]